jgi:hypothetical protein
VAEYRIEETMKFIRDEIIVEHNGSIFKRIFDHKTKKLSWQLNQSSDEFDIWTTMSEEASKNLNKEYSYIFTGKNL